MDSVDKKQLLRTLKQKCWIILLTAFLAASISFGVTRFFMTPQYEASVKMYVNNNSTSLSISASELTAAQGLVDTYIVILNTRATLDEVIQTAELDLSYEALAGMLSAYAVNGTEIFEVKVTSADPEQAVKIANTIALVLPKQIAMNMTGRDVSVVDWAVKPRSQSAPNVMKNTILGLILGALMSATAIVFREVLDDKIRSEGYLARVYEDIPLLTSIPDARTSKTKGYYSNYYSAMGGSKR